MAAETSQTLDRGLSVLGLLSESDDGMTVTEIAVALGVSRTVVYRLVVTLEQHALLRRGADGRCRLGMALLAFARQVQPVLRDAALPALRRLAESTDATACLTVMDGADALVVAIIELTRSEAPATYRVGSRLPAERGAAGRSMLASRAAAGRPIEPGWFMTRGDLHPDEMTVAAPLLGVSGIEAAVSVWALRDLSTDDAGSKVVRAAGDVSRALR
jgi:DNA-binding IclR family transcriptional regulator